MPVLRLPLGTPVARQSHASRTQSWQERHANFTPASLTVRRPADASKTGMTAEGLKQASRVKKNQISLEEAREILGVGESATWEEIEARFKKAFEANEKSGSFYLQSKIYRAHERLEEEFVEDGGGPREEQQQQDGR